MSSAATTVTQVVTRTISVSASTASSTDRATPQGGLFDGLNPTRYDTKNPITLFIIQAVLVIAFTRVLHWPLSKLRQPRVIAEVITVCSRLTRATEAINNRRTGHYPGTVYHGPNP